MSSLVARGMTLPLGMMVAFGVTSVAQAQTTDVTLGIEALARRDVRAADALFARATRASNPLIRPTAWQWRGHVAWKFHADYPAAQRYLDSALATARDSSQVLLEIARLEGARRRYDDAIRTAHTAMLRSGDAERRGSAARAMVALAVDAAFAAPDWVFERNIDAKLIADVRDTMLARVERFHGRTTDARALIDAAALVADSSGIRKGLASYFALTDTGVVTADSIHQATSIATALVRARMYESAVLFKRAVQAATTGDIRDGEAGTLEAGYVAFLRGLRAANDSIYRATIAGRARPGDMQRAINELGRRAWRVFVDHGAEGAFFPAGFYRELDRRFGAVISVERGRGADELYFAHRVGSYDVNGVPVVVLDGTIVDGIDDWLLDGAGGRAGWVANDVVYERRTGFTETPFRVLLALTDAQTIPGELFRIARDSIGDVERARRDSLGYFPGVAARIFRSGAQALLDSVKTPGAFTRAVYDNLVHTSIVLHESRHLADVRSRRSTAPADNEFRSKIDEVTGAALPRLSLTAILTPNIGDPSPHGQANRRLMIGLNRWIRRNGASIANYDPKAPALLQLPNLTDAQLRAAFASMRVK